LAIELEELVEEGAELVPSELLEVVFAELLEDEVPVVVELNVVSPHPPNNNADKTSGMKNFCLLMMSPLNYERSAEITMMLYLMVS
jgi:hypothetical protein